jgi:hypothetical protein
MKRPLILAANLREANEKAAELGILNFIAIYDITSIKGIREGVLLLCGNYALHKDLFSILMQAKLGNITVYELTDF